MIDHPASYVRDALGGGFYDQGDLRIGSALFLASESSVDVRDGSSHDHSVVNRRPVATPLANLEYSNGRIQSR